MLSRLGLLKRYPTYESEVHAVWELRVRGHNTNRTLVESGARLSEGEFVYFLRALLLYEAERRLSHETELAISFLTSIYQLYFEVAREACLVEYQADGLMRAGIALVGYVRRITGVFDRDDTKAIPFARYCTLPID